MCIHIHIHILTQAKEKGAPRAAPPFFVAGLSRNAQSTGDFGGENLRRQSSFSPGTYSRMSPG